ncbi:hypothetical protein BD410DRAFT_512937 [Rickenella mellea]|uniref:Uncharacterized protein n=1 Tax=Rickenella mellea TaxID=50990 RepID=A0A4Y7PS81_9AGAM|nr:hypothetical protein BD410DRAFT_512937 [Rickenella mellea]
MRKLKHMPRFPSITIPTAPYYRTRTFQLRSTGQGEGGKGREQRSILLTQRTSNCQLLQSRTLWLSVPWCRGVVVAVEHTGEAHSTLYISVLFALSGLLEWSQ